MKILLVRLREIGDVVFTTPALRALREHYPTAHITYIVEPHAAPVVRGNRNIDDVVVAPRGRGAAGLAADIRLGASLRKRGFDLAIDFHGGPRAGLLTWLSGAHQRVGYEVVGRSWIYTQRVARPRILRARHSVENQWDLLAALGISAADRVRHPVEMPIEREAANVVEQRLAEAGVSAADRLIVIHVSAGNPFRRWPLDQFVDLAATLAREPRTRVVLTSGPSDQAAAAQVVDRARAQLGAAHRDRIVSCPEFSLTELRALVERAALFVGGDSGPMHIAATSRVPIVGLFGPTLPARSAPWRDPAIPTAAVEPDPLPCRPCDQRVCAPGDFRCLTAIAADRVVAAAIKCLT